MILSPYYLARGNFCILIYLRFVFSGGGGLKYSKIPCPHKKIKPLGTLHRIHRIQRIFSDSPDSDYTRQSGGSNCCLDTTPHTRRGPGRREFRTNSLKLFHSSPDQNALTSGNLLKKGFTCLVETPPRVFDVSPSPCLIFSSLRVYAFLAPGQKSIEQPVCV